VCRRSVLKMDAHKKDKIEKRAWKALDAATHIASTGPWQVESRIEEIQIHNAGYREPGYDSEPTGLIATGNWNDVTEYKNGQHILISSLPTRLETIFSKMGIEIEWSDECGSCDECGGLFRTQPDSYSWTASFFSFDSGDTLCHECIKQNPTDYFEALEGDTNQAVSFDLDPEDYGYEKINKDSYASGWFPGQNDDPSDVGKEMEARSVERFLFKIDSVGQFDTNWSVYVHEDEVHLLENDAENTPPDEFNMATDIPINPEMNQILYPAKPQEGACVHCKRMNDIGITICWMCGNNPEGI